MGKCFVRKNVILDQYVQLIVILDSIWSARDKELAVLKGDGPVYHQPVNLFTVDHSPV